MTRHNPDLFVLGATPAGICAAIAAAREGASVVIDERLAVAGSDAERIALQSELLAAAR